MKRLLTRVLLAALNSRFLNATPCRYQFVGNVDAFTYQHLQSEDNQRPGITVATILDEADQFRACPVRKDGGVTVMEGGETRDATVWDLHELRQSLRPKEKSQ